MNLYMKHLLHQKKHLCPSRNKVHNDKVNFFPACSLLNDVFFISADGQPPIEDDGMFDELYETDIEAKTRSAFVLDDYFFKEPVHESGLGIIYKCQYFKEGCLANLRILKDGVMFRIFGDVNHHYQFHTKEKPSEHLPDNESYETEGNMITY